MSGDRNALTVLKIRNYRRQVIAGRLVVTREQRETGAVDWQSVHIERPA